MKVDTREGASACVAPLAAAHAHFAPIVARTLPATVERAPGASPRGAVDVALVNEQIALATKQADAVGKSDAPAEAVSALEQSLLALRDVLTRAGGEVVERLVGVDALRAACMALCRTTHADALVWSTGGLARATEAWHGLDGLVTRQYAAGRSGERWKSQSDSWYAPAQACATYRALFEAGIIPSAGEPLRFLSVSANSATHESAMCELDRELAGRDRAPRLFVASDLAPVGSRSTPPPAPGADFFHIRANASSLPFADASVDVIWDRKGRLWHAGSNDLSYRVAKHLSLAPFAAFDVLDHYHALLRPGGSVILDAAEGYREVAALAGTTLSERIDVSYEMRRRESELAERGLLPQFEASTQDILERLTLRTEIDMLHHIAKRFAVRFVGEGASRVLVLTKR